MRIPDAFDRDSVAVHRRQPVMRRFETPQTQNEKGKRRKLSQAATPLWAVGLTGGGACLCKAVNIANTRLVNSAHPWQRAALITDIVQFALLCVKLSASYRCFYERLRVSLVSCAANFQHLESFFDLNNIGNLRVHVKKIGIVHILCSVTASSPQPARCQRQARDSR